MGGPRGNYIRLNSLRRYAALTDLVVLSPGVALLVGYDRLRKLVRALREIYPAISVPLISEERMRINLRALFLLKEENPKAIDKLCSEYGLDPIVAHGVVKLLIANDGNLASLSPHQRQHFDLAIFPFIDG
ncbi:hypothetical protein CCP3SC15_2740002 [Gammaproteobacteria bacterium]